MIGKTLLREKQRQKLFMAAFISPALLFVLVYAYFPILSTLQYSFTSWDGFSKEMPWIGFGNYAKMLGDTYVWHALINNLLIVAASLFIQLPLAFLAAYTIYRLHNKWAEFFKILYFIPGVLSLVMVGLMWTFFYDYRRGVVNSVLHVLNLDTIAKPWLGDPNTAFLAILVVIVWAYFGNHCIIHSAGLNSLSKEILEAASIDGAAGLVLVRAVIIPMISEVLRVTIILAVVGSFKYFDLIWIMTNGGPFHRSDVLATYMFNQAFQAHQFGYGGAIAVLILVCALGGTLLQMLWQRGDRSGNDAA